MSSDGGMFGNFSISTVEDASASVHKETIVSAWLDVAGSTGSCLTQWTKLKTW